MSRINGMLGVAPLMIAVFAATGMAQDVQPATPEQQDVQKVTVTITDDAIQLPESLPAGQVELTIQNNGTVEHGFLVEQKKSDEGMGEEMKPEESEEGQEEASAQELDTPIPPGGTATLTVTLEVGTYAFYAPVDGDRDKGPSIEVQVQPQPAPTR